MSDFFHSISQAPDSSGASSSSKEQNDRCQVQADEDAMVRRLFGIILFMMKSPRVGINRHELRFGVRIADYTASPSELRMLQMQGSEFRPVRRFRTTNLKNASFSTKKIFIILIIRRLNSFFSRFSVKKRKKKTIPILANIFQGKKIKSKTQKNIVFKNL